MKRIKIKAPKKAHSNNIRQGAVSMCSDINIRVKNQPKHGFGNILRFFLSVITSAAMVYMPAYYLSSDKQGFDFTNQFAVIVLIFLTTLSVAALCSRHKALKIGASAFLIFTTIYILFHVMQTVDGFKYTAYCYSKKANMPQPFFAGMIQNITQSSVEMFTFAYAFVESFFIGTACIGGVNFSLLILATFPIFEIGAFWGFDIQPWTVGAMLISWITILSLGLINHRTNLKNSRSIFAIHPKKRTYYLTSEEFKKSFFAICGGYLISTTVICFIVVSLLAAGLKSYRPEKFTQLRREISLGFRDFTNDVSKNGLSGFSVPGRGKMVGGTNGGRLGLYDDVSFKGVTAMRIQTQAFSRPIYLRGYAAEDYDNNTWTPRSFDRKTADKFKENGKNSLDYNYLQIKNSKLSKYYNKKDLQIKTVNAPDDIIYAPYGTDYSGSLKLKDQKFDGIVSPKKRENEYDLSYMSIPDTSWDFEIRTLSQISPEETDGKFSFYSDFTAERAALYNVPPDLKPTLDVILASCEIDDSDSVMDIYQKIKMYFESNDFYYTLSPGTTPEDEDFIDYFLNNQKKGYCTYYASAGVMLMRSVGIPARYVEGYVVEPSQYSQETSSVRVTDRCAHAWCEIFIEGIGWFPLEFTPGYDGENPNLTDSDKDPDKQFSSDSSSKAAVKTPARTSSADSSSRGNASRNDSSRTDNSTDTSSSASGKKSGAFARTSGSGEEQKELSPAAGYFIIVVIFIVISAAGMSVRRKNTLFKYSKELKDKPDKAVCAAYRQTLRYLELIGIRSDGNLSDKQLCRIISKKIAERYPDLSQGFEKLSDLAVRCYLGNNAAEKNDASFAVGILRKTQKAVYKDLDFKQKLIAKWIYALY